ncbi:oxidoreductase [Henriciella mobilis]|uniref:proton-conducting transporter transmembrane domain-containing protein n=1 Tax=Henriciella mobilis TaxID=2305467 RepID=UPI000E66D63E|nr:proton-conducting transporter membrane subunit [Henriciella mobilis]RIJ17228.1 oxidoreductase [Henriciella mobilis]RIJ22424.1 oxidoreductase [Henriciella mobilis]
MSLTLMLLLAPSVALALLAIVSFFQTAPYPPIRKAMPFAAVLIGAASVGSLAVYAWTGAATLPLNIEGFDLMFVRFDLVSAVLVALVGFVGAIVLAYSGEYLEGEAGQGRFMSWLMLAMASVLMLVMSGHMIQVFVFWVTTSLCLHRLLLFYPGRRGAQRAARKKFVFARAGDVLLAGAGILLWMHYDTGNIAEINEMARAGGEPGSLATTMAALMLAGVAILKSAQFPFHGWLTEVMETPTPVSALLHAGIINAGGFLLIRFADVMLLAPGVLALLVLVGGFTALFGGLVMLTQPAVKTSLAWSTISQMGFMIFQCGLALFPLALLHIVLHSLYKAHAFLGSGDAVKQVASIRRPGPIALPGLRTVGTAFLTAIAIYAATTLLVGLEGKSPQAIALGAILVFGVAYMLAQGLADKAPRQLGLYTAGYSVAVTLAYFALQSAAAYLAYPTLPAPPSPDGLEWALIALALFSFALVAFAQATFPLWASHPAVRGLRVHLTNGFYINAVWDRILGGWRHSGRPQA